MIILIILSKLKLIEDLACQDDGSFGCPVANEEEQGTCDMPECQFTEWGDWSVCSGELCGGPGTNTRTRDCIPAVSMRGKIKYIAIVHIVL